MSSPLRWWLKPRLQAEVVELVVVVVVVVCCVRCWVARPVLTEAPVVRAKVSASGAGGSPRGALAVVEVWACAAPPSLPMLLLLTLSTLCDVKPAAAAAAAAVGSDAPCRQCCCCCCAGGSLCC